jgi:putative ABC transport system permease protein
MTIPSLILREIVYRKLSFALGVLGVALAVAALVTALALLRRHDLRTEQVIAAQERQTRASLATLEDDYRKITLGMGFNVLILPRDQNLGDLYAEDFANKTMPEEYATRLAQSRVATINHVLPSLTRKIKWPERARTILLTGVRGEVYMQSAKQKTLLEPVAPGTLVAGYELHRSLNLARGQKVMLLGREFTVARLNPERGGKDDITIWISLKEAQELLDQPGRISAILALECNCEQDRLAKIRTEIAGILPDTQVVEFATQAVARAETRVRAAEEARLVVEREKERRGQLRATRVALAAAVVPGVCVVSALWIAGLMLENARQRRGEIGILRALGVSTLQVLGLFLGKAVAMGLLGAALGFGAGLLIGGRWQHGAEDVGMPLTALLHPWALPAVLVVAPLVAAAASWVPALWAARQDPARVLQET